MKHTRIIALILCVAAFTFLVAPSSAKDFLSSAQRRWLNNNQESIEVLFGYEAPPDAFHDEKGEYVGLLVDFLKEIEGQLDVTFKRRDFSTWSSLMEYARVGRDFIIVGIVKTNPRSKYLDFTDPFVKIPYVIVSRESSGLDSMEDLKGKTVCAVKGYAINDIVAERFPFIRPIGVDDDLAGLRGISTGKYDAMLCKQLYATHLIHRQGLANLRITGEVGYSVRLCAATSSKDHMLFSILDKAVDQIGPSRQQDLLAKWVGGHRAFLSPGTIVTLMLAGAALLAVIVGTWLWVFLLKRSIRKKSLLLHESEAKYATYVDNSPVAILLADRLGRLRDANPAASVLLGYEREELLGMAIIDIDRTESGEELKETLAALERKGEYRAQRQMRRKDGSLAYVALHAIRLKDGSYLAFCQDVTASKRAEEDLRANEQRFRTLFEDNHMVILLVDPETGDIVDANQAAANYYGWSRDELRTKNISRINTMSDEDLAAALKLAKGHAKGRFQFKHRLASEEIRDVEVFSGPIKLKGRNILFSAIIDVTERNKSIRALETSEKRFRTMLDSVKMVAVQGYDDKHRVIYWNTASENLYGYSRQEALGKKLEDLIVPESMREIVTESVDRWLCDGVPIPSGQLDMVHKDGQMVPVYSSHVMQVNPQGEREMYCIDVDMLDIREANRQLVRAKEAAEAANRSKSEFLANMSHEIRTPMNGILGMLQLLRTTVLDQEQEEYSMMAIQSSKRLTRLLSDILDLSRVEAGKLSLQSDPFDLAEVMTQVMELYQPVTSRSPVEMRLRMDRRLPLRLVGDAARLQQILTNFIGNAVKFTQKGRITVEVNALDENTRGKTRVLFSIKDTGPGISEEKLDRLFNPFTQAAEGYERGHQGAGLGLSICKRLTTLMGGNISVESREGEGTTMYVSLPFEVDQKGMRRTNEGQPRDLAETGMRILLAEDDKASSITATRQMEKMGCRVTAVDNGRQALDALGSSDFDAVLMDVQMPLMDGVEATRAIRDGQAGEDKKNIPIIAMTAYAMRGDKEKFLQASMDGYISKPIEMVDLQNVLAGLLTTD